MAFVFPPEERLDAERQPKNCASGLRLCGYPHHDCGAHHGCVAGGFPDRDRSRSAPGLVGKYLHRWLPTCFPEARWGPVVGFATMVGVISGMFVSKAVGYILQRTGSYVPVFVMAGLHI